MVASGMLESLLYMNKSGAPIVAIYGFATCRPIFAPMFSTSGSFTKYKARKGD